MSALNNVNAEQFVNQVRKTGGASMDAGSGKLLRPGQRGYMVGGEPDTEGNQIPALGRIPSDQFGPEHVQAAMDTLNQATGGRARTNLGAWEDEGSVVLDAASRVKRPGEAVRKGRNRNQIAVWDNKHMREINTGGNDQ